MSNLVYFFIILALAYKEVVAEPISLDAVVDLTQETADSFDEKVQDGNHTAWFVKFYAPWCGHCKAMEPLWDQLAKKLKGKVRVAKVDCTVARQLAADYDVDGFPTLKLISKAKVYEYTGDRDIKMMVDWAKTGHKKDEFTPMPRDKTWSQKFWSSLEEYLISYGLPIMLLIVVLSCLWMAFGPESAEEKARLEAHCADLRQSQENLKRWEAIEKNVVYIKLLTGKQEAERQEAAKQDAAKQDAPKQDAACENKILAKHKGELLETYTCSKMLTLGQIRAEMTERYPEKIIRMINTMGINLDAKFDQTVLGTDEDFTNIPVESLTKPFTKPEAQQNKDDGDVKKDK